MYIYAVYIYISVLLDIDYIYIYTIMHLYMIIYVYNICPPLDVQNGNLPITQCHGGRCLLRPNSCIFLHIRLCTYGGPHDEKITGIGTWSAGIINLNLDKNTL